jgi:hypothetical protein
MPAFGLLVAALALPAGALDLADPDLSGAALQAGSLKQGELTRLEAEFGAILGALDDERIDTNQAVAGLFATTAASLAFVAAELSVAGDGSGVALASAQGVYSEFAVAAQERLLDALAVLDGVHVNVHLQKRFTPFLGEQRPSGSPSDAGWLASAAWSGADGSGVIGAGYGTSAGGSNGEVRLLGPGGRDETVVVPFEASPRQHQFLLITPRIVSDAPSVPPEPGDWRLELRYEADEHAADIVQITAP